MVKLKYDNINKEIEKHRIQENFKYISYNVSSKTEEVYFVNKKYLNIYIMNNFKLKKNKKKKRFLN